MALPGNNQPWPPRPWDIATSAYAINEAWYLGDVDRLAKLYSASGEQRPSHVKDGQVMAGGVVGKLKSFFWGRPVPLAQNRTRLHLPAAADLAVLSSDLMFAEPPEVRLPDSGMTKDGVAMRNAARQDRLDRIANSPAAHATFNTMGEYKAWSGASALVTRWDRELADEPWLAAVAADVVVPEHRGGKLAALTLWSEWTTDAQPNAVSTYWRHLERHERGYIVHALYKGTKDTLGVQVSLDQQDRTRYLIGASEGFGVDRLALVIPTGTERLTASYNINMPSREWRRIGELSDAGRSDYQGILPLFDTLDEVWSSWVRDIRLARARLVVPEGYLDYTGPGQASQFDVDQEIFSPVSALYRPGEAGIQLEQPDIRVEAHERTVYAVYREILRAAGYSPSAWGDYAGGGSNGAMTATEVTDRDKASERTRDKKALYDRRAIAEQAAAAMDIDAAVFGGPRVDVDDTPQVTFPPASQIDPLKNSQTIANLRAASAITVRTSVEMAHPDWDDERVDKEAEGILAESGQRLADPTQITE